MAELEPDETSSETDSAYAESAATSTASLISSITRGIEENGRKYAAYGKEEYGLPIDERELDRIDMKHKEYHLLLGDKLFLAPIDPDPQRILDVGTGSGIWAIDMADEYPSSEIIGTDLAPTQPGWVPPNCRFEIDDAEEEWTFKENHFDFIHARDFIFSIRDWPKLVRQCYRHVKQNGWVELQCIHPVPQCDDGSTPPESGVVTFSNLVIEASILSGVTLHAPTFFKDWMKEAGFEDVVERRYKVPTSPWPKNERMKLVGAFETQSLLEGASAFAMRTFAKAFGYTAAQTELELVQMRKDVMNLRHHTYYEFIVVYGRKSGS